MRSSRGICVWTALTLCGVVVLGAMVWLTKGALASERSRAEAEARADLEECTRLALWRMDAAGTALVAGENRRPPADYQQDSGAFQEAGDPLVKMHFELRESGRISSPESNGDRGKLAPLRALLANNPLPGDEWTALTCAAENSEMSWSSLPKDAALEMNNGLNQRKATASRAGNRADTTYQQEFNTVEKVMRTKSMEDNLANSNKSAEWGQVAIESKGEMPLSKGKEKPTKSAPAPKKNPTPPPPQEMETEVPQPAVQLNVLPPVVATPQMKELGQMRATWIAGELFLLRQFSTVTGEKTERGIQGVWMDQEALKERLLTEARDLLPQASLASTFKATGDPLELVSFPFMLIRNEAVPKIQASLTPPLMIGWAAVLVAILTASVLVRGIMKLSERRASFVSAVTHELRTPLTTFRLYSDMLETGAVKPEKRGDYLRVLSREADRLSHLVENVLSFSKIERGSARSMVREIGLSELLESTRERLESRLSAASLRLEMDAISDARVKVDTAAVEHILFNLIDNAAKYASGGQPPVVKVETAVQGRQVEIRVCDHGPGIPKSERARIFRAFHKSAREAAETRPGVGLGLALSRRLAGSQGGALTCVDSAQGACFVLKLPLAN